MDPFSKKLTRGSYTVADKKPVMPLHLVTQTHSTTIAHIADLPRQADGIVARWEELDRPIAIKTADCMPIVIEGLHGVVFLHAGWRGLADGILQSDAIAAIAPTHAFIGPSISGDCFEVSPEWRHYFSKSPHFSEKNNHLYFDLIAEARDQLATNFDLQHIEISDTCTKCEPSLFSYRRGKSPEQLNWNIYTPNI